jgi:hypothetical protein
VSWTTGTVGNRGSARDIALIDRAHARPRTSWAPMISVSSSAVTCPSCWRSGAGRSSGVSTTIAWRRPNRSWDACGEVDVDHALAADLDADEPAAAGHVDQPRDLEPTQSELVGIPTFDRPSR